MNIRMLKISCYLFFIIANLVFTSINGQEIGKIYSKTEADSLFGNVIESKSVSAGTLENALKKTNNYVMFKLSKDMLTILGDNRTLIFSDTSYSENNDVFSVLSKSKVLELISLSKDVTCFMENRAKTFTITKGNYTLDLILPCPPVCP